MHASMIVGYLGKSKIESGCLLMAACCERSLPWSEFGRCLHLFVIDEMPTLLSNPVEKPGKVRSGGENLAHCQQGHGIPTLHLCRRFLPPLANPRRCQSCEAGLAPLPSVSRTERLASSR